MFAAIGSTRDGHRNSPSSTAPVGTAVWNRLAHEGLVVIGRPLGPGIRQRRPSRPATEAYPRCLPGSRPCCESGAPSVWVFSVGLHQTRGARADVQRCLSPDWLTVGVHQTRTRRHGSVRGSSMTARHQLCRGGRLDSQVTPGAGSSAGQPSVVGAQCVPASVDRCCGQTCTTRLAASTAGRGLVRTAVPRP